MKIAILTNHASGNLRYLRARSLAGMPFLLSLNVAGLLLGSALKWEEVSLLWPQLAEG